MRPLAVERRPQEGGGRRGGVELEVDPGIFRVAGEEGEGDARGRGGGDGADALFGWLFGLGWVGGGERGGGRKRGAVRLRGGRGCERRSRLRRKKNARGKPIRLQALSPWPRFFSLSLPFFFLCSHPRGGQRRRRTHRDAHERSHRAALKKERDREAIDGGERDELVVVVRRRRGKNESLSTFFPSFFIVKSLDAHLSLSRARARTADLLICILPQGETPLHQSKHHAHRGRKPNREHVDGGRC